MGTTTLPFDCMEGAANWNLMWSSEQQEYCCLTTGVGCATTAFPETTPTAPPQPMVPIVPIALVRPADPYNCADGYANWQIGWSVGKKAWCCRVHGKGCPGQIGCATTSKPYDCMAGYANWMG